MKMNEEERGERGNVVKMNEKEYEQWRGRRGFSNGAPFCKVFLLRLTKFPRDQIEDDWTTRRHQPSKSFGKREMHVARFLYMFRICVFIFSWGIFLCYFDLILTVILCILSVFRNRREFGVLTWQENMLKTHVVSTDSSLRKLYRGCLI